MTNRPKIMRCRACGYDLRDINSRQCPECGRAFHPNGPATFLTRLLRGSRVLGTALLGLGLLVLPFLLAEFGSPWLLALPIIGACVALIA